MSAPRINAELELIQQILGLPTHSPCRPLKSSYDDAVFISIDCEAFEHNQNIITEIGVSVLDTRNLKDTTENREQAWLESIKSEHYRPIEHRKLVNRRFVRGCPEDFNFGHSTWIHLADIPRLLTRIFHDPSLLPYALDFDKEINDQQRNIVLVGHGISGDIAYLRKLGFSPSQAVTGSLNVIDTQRASRPTKKTPPGLARLLHSLELSPTNLHNAGNDAAYTLQALVVMAVRECDRPGCVIASVLALNKKFARNKYVSRMAPHVFGGTVRDPSRNISDVTLDGSVVSKAK